MAEQDDSTDESQKTEEPTARRLEEARKRGQVVVSREINTWVLLFAATVLIVMAGPGIMSDMAAQLRVFIASPDAIPLDGKGLHDTLQDLVVTVMKDLAVPFLVLAFAGAISGLVQTGIVFSAESLKPDLSKVSIRRGIERLFSGKSMAELAKGFVKLGVVSVAGTMALLPYFGGVEHFVGLDLGQALFDLQTMFLRMMIAALTVLFVLSILDYLYQRHVFMKSMRMSKQELKEEFKQTEGDPHVKAQLKRLREKKARQRMMQAVPEADVVITNPTHYAVALKYDSGVMQAPTMLAKGVDAVAENIKKVAKEHKVPVVENAPLARALFDSMQIDQVIPQEHWKAVAEVISYVFKLKGKRA
jgi:flagellar biosynthetic protein FlhB